MYRTLANSKLILASTSPRRRELLSTCGIEFEVIPPDCDESIINGESPENMVERLALQKAESVAATNSEAWVVGADTTVVINGKILGKPVSEDDAFAMLNEIQAKEHQVLGGIALIRKCIAYKKTIVFSSFVRIAPLSHEKIYAYIRSGEPMDKAGSYAIQGIGSSLVEEVKGSYTNVVGLNISALLNLLTENNVIQIK